MAKGLGVRGVVGRDAAEAFLPFCVRSWKRPRQRPQTFVSMSRDLECRPTLWKEAHKYWRNTRMWVCVCVCVWGGVIEDTLLQKYKAVNRNPFCHKSVPHDVQAHNTPKLSWGGRGQDLADLRVFFSTVETIMGFKVMKGNNQAQHNQLCYIAYTIPCCWHLEMIYSVTECSCLFLWHFPQLFFFLKNMAQEKMTGIITSSRHLPQKKKSTKVSSGDFIDFLCSRISPL